MHSLKILIPALLIGSFACKKTTFETKPSLELKSVSTREVIPANPVSSTPPLVLTFEFTDLEGDMAGARVGVEKISRDCSLGNFIDTVSYSISPDVPATRNLKADLEVRFTYFQISRCQFADSTEFKVWVTDRAGNISDTVSTGLIVIR